MGDVKYRWRESSGESDQSITTLSDQKNNETTLVPKGRIIISGMEGEEWFVTKRTFAARYDQIKTFVTLSQDGMPHGMCHAKSGMEARAIRMKWKFEVYYNNSDHPERGQEGWYLLQNQEEGHRGYAVIDPDIFDQMLERIPSDSPSSDKISSRRLKESDAPEKHYSTIRTFGTESDSETESNRRLAKDHEDTAKYATETEGTESRRLQGDSNGKKADAKYSTETDVTGTESRRLSTDTKEAEKYSTTDDEAAQSRRLGGDTTEKEKLRYSTDRTEYS